MKKSDSYKFVTREDISGCYTKEGAERLVEMALAERDAYRETAIRWAWDLQNKKMTYQEIDAEAARILEKK